MKNTTTAPLLPIARGALAAVLVAWGALAPLSAVADEQADETSWSVRTADNDYGTGRANFAYDVDPGDEIADTMIVTNDGTTSLTLSVYAADAFTTSDGGVDILESDEESVDAGAWVVPDVSSITLEAGESADVGFTITVPETATPGDHVAGLVTSLVSEQSSISVERRLGSRVQLRVLGELEPAAEVSGFRTSFETGATWFTGGTLSIDYSITNTGNVRLSADEAVTAAGPLGILPIGSSTERVPEIVPGSTVEVHREITDVSTIGWLLGRVAVTPQAEGTDTAVDPIILEFASVVAPAAVTVAIVIALLAAAIVVLVWRVRARRRARAA